MWSIFSGNDEFDEKTFSEQFGKAILQMWPHPHVDKHLMSPAEKLIFDNEYWKNISAFFKNYLKSFCESKKAILTWPVYNEGLYYDLLTYIQRQI